MFTTFVEAVTDASAKIKAAVDLKPNLKNMLGTKIIIAYLTTTPGQRVSCLSSWGARNMPHRWRLMWIQLCLRLRPVGFLCLLDTLDPVIYLLFCFMSNHWVVGRTPDRRCNQLWTTHRYECSHNQFALSRELRKMMLWSWTGCGSGDGGTHWELRCGSQSRWHRMWALEIDEEG